MTQAGAHLLFIVVAYALPLLLLACEVWHVARRGRGQTPPREAEDET
ncbi:MULTISPECIES: heme exporter protein CcmD [unclassified Variovorax]|nr:MULTISPECIES: heme exporter protein CcmD [unclassified Variovorax]